MTILDLIKAACKTKGVPEKYAERIQKTFKVEKSEGLEAFVDLFKENILPAIQEAESTAKTAAEEEAKKKAIEEYEKTHRLKGGKPIETPSPEGDKTKGLDPAIKELIENQNKQVQEMKAMLEKSQKEAANAGKLATAKGLISAAKLPEGWISRINVESETTLENQVKALQDDYTAIRQGAIDEAVANGDYTPGATELPERSEAEWAKLMDSDETPSNPGTVDLGISN